MRHGKKFNHLSRTTPHRKAMLSNMAASLILNKRITTTVAKAKALRKYVEPLLTKAKDDTTHSRRVVFSYLNDKSSVQTLFDEVAVKIAERPGGYTRIIKTGNRLGDNADMCIIELVDYNELLLEDKPAKSKTRRSRRGKKSETTEASAPKQEKAAKETAVAEETAEASEEANAEASVVEETETEEVTAEASVAETEEETEAKVEDATEEAPAAEAKEETDAKAEEATEDSAEPKEDKKKDEGTDEEEKK